MTYTEQHFVKGQILTAEQLNKMDGWIAEVDHKISSMKILDKTCTIGTFNPYSNGGEAGISVSPFISPPWKVAFS